MALEVGSRLRRDLAMRQLVSFSVLVMISITLPAVARVALAQPWQTYDTSNGEWRSYAGDVGGKKYSPLDQIDASNFADLEIAWEWWSVDTLVSRSTPGGGEWWAPLGTVVESLVEEDPELYRPGHPPLASRLQATPLMVGGVLYFNTPHFRRGSRSMHRPARPSGSSTRRSTRRGRRR